MSVALSAPIAFSIPQQSGSLTALAQLGAQTSVTFTRGQTFTLQPGSFVQSTQGAASFAPLATQAVFVYPDNAPSATTLQAGAALTLYPGDLQITGTLPAGVTSQSPPAAIPSTSLDSAVTTPPAATGASATSAPSTPATSTPKPHCDSKTGAIAGAAVGAAVGVAIIAALLLCLLLRRRSSATRNQAGHNDYKTDKGPALYADDRERPVQAKSADAFRWQKQLPQSEDDATVQHWAKTVFDLVEQHVENFYANSKIALTSPASQALEMLYSKDRSNSPAGLLSRSDRPCAIIQHCMLQHILLLLQPGEGIEDSLLPRDFVSVPLTLSQQRHITPKDRDFRDQAFSQWRVLTSVLRAPPNEDNTFIHERDAEISRTVNLFSTAFKPWQKRSHRDDDRAANMTGILQNASDKGIKLFSQPSSFAYSWQSRAAEQQEGVIIVTPGFLKTTNDSGIALPEPQVLIRRKTAKY